MDKQWTLASALSAEARSRYGRYGGVLAQLLANRGITPAAASVFFSSDNETQWHSPWCFNGMRQAVDLIVAAVRAGEKIAICGDYDADGVTATAVLAETLQTLKARVEIWIPDRLTEGYGLNKRVWREALDAGCRLLITVDNGIRSREEAAAAKEAGLTVIVTDHHEPPAERSDWPDCLILNPRLPDENYPFKYLAGVGVAFKLASALVESSTLDQPLKERLQNRITDLVAVGTVADCVKLVGENRFLVRQGLREINRRCRLGLAELIEVSQLRGDLTAENISWQLAPRLNVAGRLDHANTAYELLITTDATEAAALAKRLNEKNAQRQADTQALFEYGCNFVDEHLADDRLLILTSPNLSDPAGAAWHEGIIGLVAGRLAEYFHRPTLVITLTRGQIKGSGRSIAGYDILSVLERNKDHLSRYGGHKAACGFTIKDGDNLRRFQEAARAMAAQDLTDNDLRPSVNIDVELPIAEINETLVEDLRLFEPFGQANPEPIFVSRDLTVRDKMTMGLKNQHVKFKFNNFWAVAFGESDKWQSIRPGDRVDAVYTLEFNDFNGSRSIQWRLVDMRPTLS